jgi:hypothetical protein
MMYVNVPRDFEAHLRNRVQARFSEYRLFECLFSPRSCAVVKVVFKFGTESSRSARVYAHVSVRHLGAAFSLFPCVFACILLFYSMRILRHPKNEY